MTPAGHHRSVARGFAAYQATDDALFDLFAKLRSDRLIP
jgi:hypothetical protein